MRWSACFCWLAVGLGAPLARLEAQDKKSPEQVEATNLAKLNTKFDETDPAPTADGLGLFFASNAAGSFDLMQARRGVASGPWGAPSSIKDLNSDKYDERAPHSFGARLYFASNVPPAPEFEKLKNFDVLERNGELAPLRLLHINTHNEESTPCVAAAGKELFVSRKTEDGWRVFVTKGPALGAPDKGKMIEELPAGFHHPAVAANGLTMYLQGPLDKDRWGLFRTTRKATSAKWGKPEPLDSLNHPEGKRGDLSPSLSAAGTILYFSSDRPGGMGGLDLWWVSTAKLAPKK